MRRIKKLLLLLSALLLTACYNHGPQTPDALDLTKEQLDSISFFTTHHYTENYNFVVNAKSLPLSDQPGDLAFDTLYVVEGEHLVVADIQTIPTDSIDSVWVKVARDQLTQGWIRESEMLTGVSPDDPISQFIDFFSDAHQLIFLAVFIVVTVVYVLYLLSRRKTYIVHFHDIDSVYPTLLCLLVASSATLYASIQMFEAETWRHFYYHPTLNPLALPSHLGLFIASVWAIVILLVAAIDDVLRHLSGAEALLYLSGLAGVCAVNYIVFSISTLYYIGYPLLAIYLIFSFYRYFRYAHCPYVCGHCGASMASKGRCPHCGTANT